MARTHPVGYSKDLEPPKFPKDDSNVSTRGTLISKGRCLCRHCGSDNHWDSECTYARKATSEAKVNSVELEDALAEYEDLVLSLETDNEEDDEDQEQEAHTHYVKQMFSTMSSKQ